MTTPDTPMLEPKKAKKKGFFARDKEKTEALLKGELPHQQEQQKQIEASKSPATPGIVDEATATQSKEAPLGATWQDRIKNATASDDDIRTAYEEYKKGNYQPGPKTMEEFQKMGLMEQPSNEQPAEIPQPQAEVPENPTAQESEEATQTTDATVDNQSNTDTTADTTDVTPEQEAQVEDTKEEVQEEIQSKSDDELKSYLSNIEKSLNTNDEEKAKMAGIFEAYKNGDIDKNQRNYFLADAIARFASNIAEIQDTKNQNALWANITSGNQKAAKVDVSPNEWQNYLKTDWQEAQKLKNEARSKATMEKVETDMAALRKAGQDKYLYNDFPTMVKDSSYMKLPAEQRTQVAQVIAISNGAPYNADQLGNISDILGNAKLGNTIGELTVQSMKDSHDVVQGQIKAQNILNMYAEQKQQLEIKQAQGAISTDEYDREMKRLLNEQQKLENQILEATKETKINKEQAELINTKYADTTFKLTGKIPGLGEAGATVTGAALVNAGMDITDAIKKGLAKPGK